MTRHLVSKAVVATGLVGALSVLAACGGGSGDNAASGGGGGGGGACAAAPAGTKVNLTFSSWVPGMQKVVDLWNSQNPNIQVKYKEVVGGNAGTYQAYSNQLKAGKAGDLGMIEFDNLASFRLQDGLLNIGPCASVKAAAPKFVPWTIEQVSFGEPGAVYGIPQDIGPLALYYRKDLFAQNNIKVPTTWDEYYTAAKQIKAKGAFISNLPPDQPAFLAALAWQNGAQWFSTDKDGKWTVSLTDPKALEVANYWQRMLDEKLVDTKPGLGPIQWKAMDTDKEWALPGAAWTAKLIENGAPKTKGKWAVAPLPQWTPGGTTSGNWGGSNTVVFKGTKYPAEAAKFAVWAESSLEANELSNKNGGQFPATTAGETDLPALKQPYPYFGGQVIWPVFQQAAKGVDPNFLWGPTMTQTYADLGNGLSAAVNGKGTLTDALKAAQTKTISTLKSQSIPVAE
jgi:multiple sugar transport system substrate-binding protein